MRPISLIVLAASLSAAAFATPVEDFRAGQDASFDLHGATITGSGAVSINQVITDDQAPTFCAPKQAGSLDILVDLANLGFPASIPVTLTGTELSSTSVRWEATVDVNQCLSGTLPDGTSVNFLVREVMVRLTGELSSTPAFTDEFCVARRGVSIQTIGGDAGNSLDVTAYALCLQTSFTRVNIDGRDINASGRAGPDPCPGDTNADNVVNFADLNAVLSLFGAQAAPGELVGDLNLDGAVNFADLNAALSAFGSSCVPN